MTGVQTCALPISYTLPVSALPLELPEVEKYLPTEDGDPPLGNAKNFAWDEASQKVVASEKFRLGRS